VAREITSVGVVGLGTMGAGIVEVFARSGITVVGVDIVDEALQRARGVLAASSPARPTGPSPAASSPRRTGTRCWAG